jgi:nucleotide sugar dehydrogenase
VRITVVGMGKIGLPLAVQYARKGHTVVGTDINADTVDLINSGIEPFPGEDHLQQFLTVEVAAGRLIASLDTAGAVSQSDAVVIVVPLFVDSEAIPEFSAMDAATNAVATGLKSGTLVSYETTLPVGTTRDRLVPLLEAGSGLEAGKDFFVVFSPERVLTGRVFKDLRRYPKLVGGIDLESEKRGFDFYSQVLDFDERPDLLRANGVWCLGSTEAAELAKLAETTYRDVNIALANQFATFAEKSGIDFTAVAEACNSQPYSHIHSPGIAVGGHCIPVYPRLYLWNDPSATVVRAAREANAQMPETVVSRVESEIGSLSGLSVAVLGASYRGGVKETAFSGVFATVAALESRGAIVSVHDPLYSDSELQELGFEPFHRGNLAAVAIIQADHSEYGDWKSRDIPGVRLVMDGRGVSQAQKWDASVIYLAVGQPSTDRRE